MDEKQGKPIPLRWLGQVILLLMMGLWAPWAMSDGPNGSILTLTFPPINVQSRVPQFGSITNWVQSPGLLIIKSMPDFPAILRLRAGGRPVWVEKVDGVGESYNIFGTSIPGVGVIARFVTTDGAVTDMYTDGRGSITGKPDVSVYLQARLVKVGAITGSVGFSSERLNDGRMEWTTLRSGNQARTLLNYFSSGAITTISTTCSISAPAVTMSKVSIKRLSAAGMTGDDTPITIRLSNCTEGAGGTATSGRNVSVYFDGPMVDLVTGRLKLDDTGRNAQIELRNDNASKTVVSLGAAGTQNADISQINGGNATLKYLARYYATGATTVGPANSRVSFTVVYP